MSGAGIATVLATVLLASTAFAQGPTRDTQAEHRIEQELDAIAPGSVPAFRGATVALDRQDYAEAVRLYRQVLERAPRFAPALRRVAFALVQTGRPQEGLRLAREAVSVERSPENLISLAGLLAPPGDKTTSPEARAEALALAKEATGRSKAHDSSYLVFTAELALWMERERDFRAASEQLSSMYPDEMLTHYFNAVRAVLDQDWPLAEREIAEAQRRGLPDASARAFLDSEVRTRMRIRRWLVGGVSAMVVWSVGLVLLFAVGKLLSTLTLRSIGTGDGDAAITPREQSLRRIYRVLIQVAGTYYYVSLPIVLLLVLGGTAAVIYAFLMLGHVPVRLVVFLGLGALVTSVKMVQSLFLRVDAQDPGRSLEAAEAPGLWDLTQVVARDVGTRPIDEIRVTPGTELAVYERGTFRQRAQGRGRRVLLLGVGVLDGFRQAPFCAVLAHEYGHFSHGDTAGGDIALPVRQDMMKFAIAMMQHGQAVWWNAAFQFLRLYDFLFRRISHGATRLQEILADRVAARLYGVTDFKEGLHHVIRRQIEFTLSTHQEINAALQAHRCLQNLYGGPPPSSPELEEKVAQALARVTTDDDTHPAPADRISLLSRLVSKSGRPYAGMVWDLFASPATLTAEMTAQIDSRLQQVAASQQTAEA
jgi:hypothetical protein